MPEHDLAMCCGTTCDKNKNEAYVRHLEEEVERLKAANQMLTSELTTS